MLFKGFFTATAFDLREQYTVHRIRWQRRWTRQPYLTLLPYFGSSLFSQHISLIGRFRPAFFSACRVYAQPLPRLSSSSRRKAKKERLNGKNGKNGCAAFDLQAST